MYYPQNLYSENSRNDKHYFTPYGMLLYLSNSMSKPFFEVLNSSIIFYRILKLYYQYNTAYTKRDVNVS